MLGFGAIWRSGDGMGEFFSMGGYAAFVWPAYAVSAIGIGGLVFFIWRRAWRIRERLARAEDRAARKAP